VTATADEIEMALHHLDMPVLRATFHNIKNAGFKLYPDSFFEVRIDLPNPVDEQKLRGLAEELNKASRITLRCLELATVGMRARVAVEDYDGRGAPYLCILVHYNERGQRTLEGSGFPLSEAIRIGRKFLCYSFYVIAVIFLLFVFADRFARNGWRQTLIGASLVLLASAAAVFVRRGGLNGIRRKLYLSSSRER
jgi:hypothetical protein